MPPFPDLVAAPPSFHPADELLLDYATGATSSAESLLLAAHLTYCAACRNCVDAARRIGGRLLDVLEPAHLPPNMLNRTLAAIDARATEAPVAAPRLSELVHRHMAAHGHWRHLPAGFRMRRIHGDNHAGRVWLFDSSPGMKLLPHRHVGDEWTVILSGVLIDGGHAYHVGDFARLEDGQEHRPKIGIKNRCVSLILVRDAPQYTTPLGKLAAPFIKL
jgi:putative transcriptional regulator